MGRLGLLTDDHRPGPAGVAPADAAVREVTQMAELPGLHLEGIFTHFASADSADKTYTRDQLALFETFVDRLQKAGLSFEIRHAANSGGIIDRDIKAIAFDRGPKLSFFYDRPGI